MMKKLKEKKQRNSKHTPRKRSLISESKVQEDPDFQDDIEKPEEDLEPELSSSGLPVPAESFHSSDNVSSDLSSEEASVRSKVLVPAQQDLLRQYLVEIARYPLLTPEEEFQEAVRLKETGAMESARRLVRANLRLVVKIAMEYRSAYQNILDLIQEGNIGLLKAVSKFDPAKGAKLSYYASWWIRSYILKYILDNFRLVRVGTTQAQKKLFFHLVREKERLEAQGLDAGPKLLASRLQVREQDVVEMEQRLSGRGAEMSLNHPLGSEAGEDESKGTFLDLLADTAVSPDEKASAEELRAILSARLEEFARTLKDKELTVFRERLAAEEPKTLQEVADQYGLTRERARQIEVRVIEKLRDFFKPYMR